MIFTFQCRACEHQFDRQFTADEIVKNKVVKCEACKKKRARRIFLPQGVIPDEFKNPVHMVTMESLTPGKDYDTVYSRSEQRRLVQEYNRVKGTHLELV